MRFCFVNTVRAYRTSAVLRALPCLAVALLVACGGRETPPINSVDLAVVGQTVTKVRTAGNEVVFLVAPLHAASGMVRGRLTASSSSAMDSCGKDSICRLSELLAAHEPRRMDQIRESTSTHFSG